MTRAPAFFVWLALLTASRPMALPPARFAEELPEGSTHP